MLVSCYDYTEMHGQQNTKTEITTQDFLQYYFRYHIYLNIGHNIFFF